MFLTNIRKILIKRKNTASLTKCNSFPLVNTAENVPSEYLFMVFKWEMYVRNTDKKIS